MGRDSRESREDTEVEWGRLTVVSSWCSVRCILRFFLLVRRLGRQNIAAAVALIVTDVLKRDVAVADVLKRDVALLVTGQLLRKLSLTNSDLGGWAGLGGLAGLGWAGLGLAGLGWGEDNYKYVGRYRAW